jgi:hypothetical protein
MARSMSRVATSRWRERIDGWRRSNLSVAEYCRQEQLSPPSFFAWRKRLTAGAVMVAKPAKPQSAANGRGQSRFVELPPPAWPALCGVQITLPGGAVVMLPRDASSELLAAAIRAAMATPAAEVRPC